MYFLDKGMMDVIVFKGIFSLKLFGNFFIILICGLLDCVIFFVLNKFDDICVMLFFSYFCWCLIIMLVKLLKLDLL